MPWTRAAEEMCDVEALHVLVAGVRSGAGDDGAGDDGDAGRGASAHTRRRRGLVTTGPAPAAVGLAGPPHEHDCRGDEDHRQQHVALHGKGVEVDEHGDPAEHDLAQHAGDEPERQPVRSRRRGGATATRARRRSRRSATSR